MKRGFTRREFLGASAAAAAALPLVRFASGSAAPVEASRIANVPFDLSRVRLLPGPFFDAADVNRRFLLNLDPDRLLHMFRLTAGLPSTALPLGGWEAPENELRGHYTGHYLSACAMRAAGFSDDEAKARGDRIVAELAKCQEKHGNDYLSAFPEELFDRLRADERVWAPFYTLHKILAGLLDMHTLAGNARALDVAAGMATWISRWTQPLGEAAMARVLEREYGGMNEALYNLSAITGSEDFRELAHRFDHERIFAPLAEGRDELKGLHANTTIPKIIGAARRYELTGESRYRRIAEYFWREVATRRAYCTGGTSNGESWNAEPGAIASELSGYTQECCVTYNMLKLARHVGGWTGDPACAEFIERAMWNGILGTQHPADGSKLYYVPLASGYWKLFGTPLHDFWCCTGTGSESFSKLGESVYFRAGDALLVDQFVSSELDWKEKGLRVVQETRFPEESVDLAHVSSAAPDPGRDAPARSVLDGRGSRRPAQRPGAGGLCGAGRLLRPRPGLERRRPHRAPPADGPSRRADARRSRRRRRRCSGRSCSPAGSEQKGSRPRRCARSRRNRELFRNTSSTPFPRRSCRSGRAIRPPRFIPRGSRSSFGQKGCRRARSARSASRRSRRSSTSATPCTGRLDAARFP